MLFLGALELGSVAPALAVLLLELPLPVGVVGTLVLLPGLRSASVLTPRLLLRFVAAGRVFASRGYVLRPP